MKSIIGIHRSYCPLKRFGLIFLLGICYYILPATELFAQNSGNNSPKWTYINRIIITGSSDQSDPKNYQVYSAFTLEAAIRKQINAAISAELNIKTESREVDFTEDT
ncbi:MAG: hypothetical protein P8048_04615, partial [Calditrichia bacterium]